jgi:hypothetical protein
MLRLTKQVSIRQCPVYVSGGVLYGSGYYNVRTITEDSVEYLPWTITKSGPAVVYSGYSCSSFVFLAPTISFYWVIPAILFLIGLIIIPFSFRWSGLKKTLLDLGYSSKLTCYGVKLSGPSGTKRIPLLRFLMYCYFLTNSYVESCVNTSIFIGNYSLFSGFIWNNQRICTIDGDITMPPNVLSFNLNLEYKSFEFWEHNRVENWGCGGGTCPSIEECFSMNMVNYTVKSYLAKRTFCSVYPHHCAMSRGCWFGVDKIEFSQLFEIYSFSAQSYQELSILQNDYCKILINDRNNFDISTYNVVKSKNSTYMCRNVNKRGHVKSGFIGDNQVVNNKMIFDWKSITCDESWYKTSVCEYIHHDIIDKSCTLLPNVISGIKFYESDSRVFAMTENNLLSITGSCSSKFINHLDECYNVKISVHGTREEGSGLFVVVSADSRNSSSTIIKLICLIEIEIHVICDGNEHHFPISESDKCHNVTDKTIMSSGFHVLSFKNHGIDYVEDLELHNVKHVISASIVMVLIILTCLLCIKCIK